MVASSGDFRSFAAARLGPLYRAAVLLTGEHQAAEDLVQETLTRMYVAWRSRRIDDPVAYARTVLVNTFISGRRRRSASEYPHADVPEVATPPADVAARVDVQRALGGLGQVDRAIVVMRYLEDVPVDDVAAVLGMSPGNVRVRATRALARLRTSLPLQPAESSTREDTHD
jgi:RNA polymerase sigma-70 factor (sigma-E family)